MALKKYTNTVQTDLAIIQTLAADLVYRTDDTADFLTAGKLSASIGIWHAKDSASAPVGAGTKYTIEKSYTLTGDDNWMSLYWVQAGITAPTAMVTDGEEVATSTVIECGNVIPAVGDIICFKNATIGLTEFREVIARVTTGGSETVTLKDALTSTQAQGTYYTQVEKFDINLLNLKGVVRLRVFVNNNLGTTNRAIIFRIALTTCDGIG
jgi:hypothetical protein